jgi:MoaA/NifB/PqqE/SkfB family radical SAM enzyme
MKYVSENYPAIEITIRTVISKINKDDIENIGNLLSDTFNYFDRWKLYQFTPVGQGFINSEKCHISSDEFLKITDKILKKFRFNIFIFPSERRIGRYIFIGPDGNIFGIDEKGQYKVVSNFKTNSKKEIEKSIIELIKLKSNKPL